MVVIRATTCSWLEGGVVPDHAEGMNERHKLGERHPVTWLIDRLELMTKPRARREFTLTIP